MNPIYYYVANVKNLAILRELGVECPDGDYLCPLCLQPFYSDVAKQQLTDEHVPQASLGGHKLTLTCKKCNNDCGQQIDIHLLNTIIRLEQQKFLEGTNRDVFVLNNDQRLKATLEVGPDRELKLLVNEKRNNPKIWENFHDNILLKDSIIDIQNAHIKRDYRNISAAIIKNAYLILFARTGYTFLLDKHYDCLRQQILNPAPYLLPERLWTFQNLRIPDGIYLTRNNIYRGFFIVYTLTRKQSYRVCVFIPTPKIEYLAACYELREIEANDRIQVVPLPNDIDFISDKDAIVRLREWCYGWNLIF